VTLHWEIVVDFELTVPKFPDCFTPNSTTLTQSHSANTMKLHMTLNTVLAPTVDQVVWYI
ncbi:MAG: hypothetical protein ACKPKO_33805, partial [Candidatus Fonsibacter sp.]